MENRHKPTAGGTGEEWEGVLGRQIRDLRLRANHTQSELARRANVDRTTLARIELGEGGTLRSLVQIARALGREEWLDALAPPAPTVSPMELLREKRRRDERKRVRARQRSRSKPS